MMKRTLLIIITLVFLSILSCDLFDPGSSDIPDWYPSTWTLSDSKMDEFDSVFTDFSTHFNLDEIVFNYTDSLCSHIEHLCSRDIIQLCSHETSSDPLNEFETNFRIFLDNWWRLISIEEFEIKEFRSSLIVTSNRIRARIIPKSTYKYPLNSPDFELGRLQVELDENGYMEVLWSNLVPQLPVPGNPIIDKAEAKDIVDGYEFKINKWPFIEDVTLSKEDIKSSELQVLIIRDAEETNIKYLLIWSLRVEDGDIYVDAMTGEILGYHQTTIYG